MGTINPEVLYNKVYNDWPPIKKPEIMNDNISNELRMFLQRKKADYKGGGDEDMDQDLMESLSEMLRASVDAGGEICKDIQDGVCGRICNKIENNCNICSRMVVGGLFVATAALIVYKIRVKMRGNNNNNVICNVVNSIVLDNQTHIEVNPSDEEVIEVPYIVHIRKGWFS